MSNKDRQPTSAKPSNTTDNITLDTDEIGIWLINEAPEGPQQMGLVTWHEVTKRIQRQLLQEKFMLVLAELDKEMLDAE